MPSATERNRERFAVNLRHLLVVSGVKTLSSIAPAFKINASFLSKLIHGKSSPSPLTRDRIAAHFGITADDLALPPARFRSLAIRSLPQPHSAGEANGEIRIVRLRNIWRHRDQWKECFQKHRGQYILYNRLHGNPNIVAASLLEVTKLTECGIEVSITDPAPREDGTYFAYLYAGLMYPLSDFLYIYADQLDGDYEVINLILNAAPEPRPELLTGVISGIGVELGEKKILQSRFVLHYQRQRIKDWTTAVANKRLGFLGDRDLPRYVAARLKP